MKYLSLLMLAQLLWWIPETNRSNVPLASEPAAQTITIDNFKFAPAQITVTEGTTLTWQNRDDVPHTVTSDDDPPLFDSKAIDTDGTFSFKFGKPGVYHYYCKLHHHMTGTVTVK